MPPIFQRSHGEESLNEIGTSPSGYFIDQIPGWGNIFKHENGKISEVFESEQSWGPAATTEKFWIVKVFRSSWTLTYQQQKNWAAPHGPGGFYWVNWWSIPNQSNGWPFSPPLSTCFPCLRELHHLQRHLKLPCWCNVIWYHVMRNYYKRMVTIIILHHIFAYCESILEL